MRTAIMSSLFMDKFILGIWFFLLFGFLSSNIQSVRCGSSESHQNLVVESTNKTVVKMIQEELIQAVKKNDIESMLKAIEKGANVKAITESGDSLLHIAARSDSVDAARKLIELHLAADIGNKDGYTPLWIAAGRGNVEMMALLGEKGGDISVKMKSNGWWGRTLLHETASKGKDGAVNWLLSKGADINVQDNLGWTPLHLAASEGHLSTTKTLINSGANVTIADNDGEVPLHETSRRGHLSVVELLLNGTSPNVKNKAGVTPIHAAASKGHKKIVALLLDHGGQVNSKTNDGWTPLHEAANGGHLDTVMLLLDRGAYVDPKDKDGWTPLFSAAAMGHTVIVQILSDRKADIRVKANNGMTSLHEAASRGHFDTVKELIERRADINAKSNDGRTPLKVASIWDQRGVMDLLRSKGGQM